MTLKSSFQDCRYLDPPSCPTLLSYQHHSMKDLKAFELFGQELTWNDVGTGHKSHWRHLSYLPLVATSSGSWGSKGQEQGDSAIIGMCQFQ